ncbi:hypothetical protein XSR1_10031 [Xenorhabdus szentirmaii DSM 16338]|uniref:Uncharacterized protein n=1 Tax=Xenorhabdus szentirmaii DSM 16338 TaxID=1427518 RepID=W1IQ46_9GAMM|nr:hypothetical protein XSR1_10031 [Xenorhabdus szentirmaii DSM 16338]
MRQWVGIMIYKHKNPGLLVAGVFDSTDKIFNQVITIQYAIWALT